MVRKKGKIIYFVCNISFIEQAVHLQKLVIMIILCLKAENSYLQNMLVCGYWKHNKINQEKK